MRIQQIKLTNFKYFDNLTLITENRDVVVLLGPNGVGKSCVFDAIFSASENSKYRSTTQDYTYYRKDKKKDHNVDIALDDGSILTITANNQEKKVFYGRTSYRFTKEISRSQIGGGTGNAVSKDQDGKLRLSDLDQRIENDVEVALSEMLIEVQKKEGKTDVDIVNKVIGPTNESLARIFGGSSLKIKEIVDPIQGENNKCDVKFEKNGSDFSFKNLSAGEKEIFDIIFNFHRRKEKWIRDGVYYIDEPDLHINTKIQRNLFDELVRLAAEVNAQLWMSTHSLGFMRGAQELFKSNPSKVSIFEFKEEYANKEIILSPQVVTREDWKYILETALDDLTSLVTPEIIYYCEGKAFTESGQEEGLDALAYKAIFKDYYNIDFISSGGGNEVKIYSLTASNILQKLSSGKVKILVLKDGDYKSNNGTILDAQKREGILRDEPNLRLLSRLELENYILDKAVLRLYCQNNSLTFDENKVSAINFEIDSLKKFKPQIMQSIGHQGKWENMPFISFAETIYKEKSGDLKYLYDSLVQDLKLLNF